MISSSFIEFSTPQKEFVFNDSVTPTKVDLKKRFCPSKENVRRLSQMARVHDFLRHKPLEFSDLRKFDISVQDADKLSVSLQSQFDIPDVIHRMEEKAVQCEYFTEFLSQYVSEEFSIERDYSFTCIALLHYMKFNNISVEEAVNELLNLSSSQTICKVCCSEGETEVEKERVVQVHNMNILKSLLQSNCSDSEDISVGDDSREDPEFIEKHSESSSSDLDSNEQNENYCKVDFNPFDCSDEDNKSTTQNSNFTPSVNSTFYSPFDEDSNPEPCSSSQVASKQIQCGHCSAKFSNKNNMKQHLISVHRICPPGMQIFYCSTCPFMCGNRVAYSRHLETHKKKKKKIDPVFVCYNCNPSREFSTPSSLKRHKIRFDHW